MQNFIIIFVWEILGKMLVMNFDGLCEPINPKGIACYGFVIYKNGEKIHEEGGFIGAGMFGDDVSNNVAEYMALIKGLEWLIRNGMTDDEVIVYGDSRLIIYQLNNLYAVRAYRIIPLYERVQKLIPLFKKIIFKWIPREENVEADRLSRKAYNEFVRVHWNEIKKYYGRYF
jgi:ribonuclease HI